MTRLMLKDFSVQKKGFLNYCFIAVFLGAFFAVAGMGQMVYAVVAFPIIYGFINRAFYEDEKNNTLRLLASLPVKRESLVYSRYASVAVMAVVVSVFTMVLANVLQLLELFPDGGPAGQVLYVSLILFVLVVIVSCYLPLLFKLGYIRAATINRFVLIGVFGGIGLLGTVLSKKAGGPPPEIIQTLDAWIEKAGTAGVLAVVGILSTLLYLISMQFSVAFFRKRNLYK